MENVLFINNGAAPEVIDEAFAGTAPKAVVIEEFPDADFVSKTAEKLRANKASNIIVSLNEIPNDDAVVEAITGLLLPMADVIIPSLPEAEDMDRMSITSEPDMEVAAKQIADSTGAAVVLLPKGIYAARNLLFFNGKPIWFEKPLTIEEIAAGMAEGKSIDEVIL